MSCRLNTEINDFRVDYLKKLQGTWVHNEDKLASVLIAGRTFTFKYSGEKGAENDKYEVTIKDRLPQFIDKNVKARLLILSNKSDTMYCEILGLNDKVLSLMHFPSGVRDLYDKKK